MCMDGIPAFSSRTKSLNPVDLKNFSLCPALRIQAQFILLLMLIPSELKAGMKKYFDFAASYELNDLFYNGIDGIKCKIFGTSLDSPGRAEMLGFQGHMGYTSCCVCKHCFSPGIGTSKTCIFDGYRNFLQTASRGRRRRVQYRGQQFEYSCDATREKPQLRDDSFVRSAVAFVKQRKSPYMGHKSVPLLSKFPGYSWYRMNMPDLMHGN